MKNYTPGNRKVAIIGAGYIGSSMRCRSNNVFYALSIKRFSEKKGCIMIIWSLSGNGIRLCERLAILGNVAIQFNRWKES